MISTVCGLPVDWSATGDMLSGWGALAGAGAVAYAAWRGGNTFDSWRRQKSEGRRIDLAEDVLSLAYRLERAFSAVRGPGMLPDEIRTVEARLREIGAIDAQTPPGTIQMLTTAQAALMRLEDPRELFEKLLDIRPSAKAIFGAPVDTPLGAFWLQRGSIISAANGYARTARRAGPLDDAALRFRERMEGVLWEGGDEEHPDEIRAAIAGAIGSLEAVLLPIIRGDQPKPRRVRDQQA